MNFNRSLFTCLLFSVVLSACVTTPGYDSPVRTPVEVEDRVIVNGKVLPIPDEPRISIEALPGQQASSPVVRKLLVIAQDQASVGNVDSAANSLERALRIEPRNAVLWSRLAGVRYQQSDFKQAVQLAAKSNTLSGSDRQLRRQNWYLMANAYSAVGDVVAAQKYRDKLNR